MKPDDRALNASAAGNRLMKLLKPAIFVLCLFPFVHLVWDGFTGGLGVGALDALTDRTGNWAIRFLMISLAMRPLRQVTGRNVFIRFRRMTGLFAFFYASLHLVVFLVFDNGFDREELIEDLFARTFVTAGFTAWLILLALAVTSTRGWIRRLGGSRWQALHRLVYLGILAAMLHFLWSRKLIEATPVIYTAAAILLLGFRVFVWSRPRLASGKSP